MGWFSNDSHTKVVWNVHLVVLEGAQLKDINKQK